MTHTFSVRAYRSADCESLAELFYQTVHAVNAKDYTGERIVGFGDIAASGYLDRLYVHKDWQGMGVATVLCDKLEQAVAEARIVSHISITAKPFFYSAAMWRKRNSRLCGMAFF